MTVSTFATGRQWQRQRFQPSAGARRLATLPRCRQVALVDRRQSAVAGDGADRGGAAVVPRAAEQSAARRLRSNRRLARAQNLLSRTPHAVVARLPRTFITAMNALRRNKMRSALSALGVIIAVAAVIAMTEIGQGSKAAIQKTHRQHGRQHAAGSVRGGLQRRHQLRRRHASCRSLPQDAEEIARQCPAVIYVSPLVRARAQIVYGNRNWVPTFINGVGPTYLKVQEWEDFDEGEMFTDADVRNANKVALSARLSGGNSSRANLPSARSFASRTSPSGSSAC